MDFPSFGPSEQKLLRCCNLFPHGNFLLHFVVLCAFISIIFHFKTFSSNGNETLEWKENFFHRSKKFPFSELSSRENSFYFLCALKRKQFSQCSYVLALNGQSYEIYEIKLFDDGGKHSDRDG